jgi:GntR family transcriptional regulator/MocR family aminotransferase
MRVPPSSRPRIKPAVRALSLPRRLACWTGPRSRAWIVEDDYDGEYRYVSRPLPALQSLDRDGRVLYSGTFSKVLFPAIRLAYLVVPPAQVPRFDEITRTFAAGGATLMQKIVADFMNEGHFARHIQRMRRLYGERRQLAADGLSPYWASTCRSIPSRAACTWCCA